MWDGILSHDYFGEFKGKKIVIAGGGGGIGAAIASGFHWLGAHVIILDKNEEPAKKLAALLGVRAECIIADLANENERGNAVEAVCTGGDPYALISTLGYDRRVDLASHGQAEMEELLRVNFIAPIMLARDLVGPIRRRGGGSICLFTSHHGLDLFETNMMGYGAGKAALDNGIKRLAKFAGQENTPGNRVRIFGLRPGWVLTENQAARFDMKAFDAAVEQQILPMRMVAEDLVPFVISNLCERNAKLLSGTILDYDAGGLLQRASS